MLKGFKDFTDDKTSMRVKLQAIIGFVILNAQIYGMLYVACNDDRYREKLSCAVNNLPMISTIGALHPYDRWFVTVLTMNSVFNIFPVARSCFIKIGLRLGKDNKWNNDLYTLALTAIPALPMIGLFDYKTSVHGVLAAYFFLGSSFYLWEVTRILLGLRAAFDERGQRALRWLFFLRWGVLFFMGGLAIAMLLQGSRGYTPWFEWGLATYITGYFIIVTNVEDYVNQVSDNEPIPTKEDSLIS